VAVLYSNTSIVFFRNNGACVITRQYLIQHGDLAPKGDLN
jgi:hypothetical protein